ncbi:hypothetical protein ACWDFR_44725 [Streptomyces sp. 900105755]
MDAPGWRNYTISRAGDRPAGVTAEYREGGFVPLWPAALRENEQVLVTNPFGDAVVDTEEDRPLLVLTAGIGITPALAMDHTLAGARSAPLTSCTSSAISAASRTGRNSSTPSAGCVEAACTCWR